MAAKKSISYKHALDLSIQEFIDKMQRGWWCSEGTVSKLFSAILLTLLKGEDLKKKATVIFEYTHMIREVQIDKKKKVEKHEVLQIWEIKSFWEKNYKLTNKEIIDYFKSKENRHSDIENSQFTIFTANNSLICASFSFYYRDIAKKL